MGDERVTTKTPKTLPKMLPGTVCAQWARCGKPVCKCARGELHGPYYYRFWREGGRLRKVYVRPADLAVVRAACDEERQFLRLGRLARALGQQDWRRLSSILREIEGNA